MKLFQAEPIGYFHSLQKEKYNVPRQPNQAIPNEGVIKLQPNHQFEQALEGLEKFDRIWIIFWFHINNHWKTKVLPPRGNRKRGVFATRSPHRPNFIGLSCVELKSIEGLNLFINTHDLIDGTPILDIKPYLNYSDSLQALHQGWLEEVESEISFVLNWSEMAQKQLFYLVQVWQLNLQTPITTRLSINPFPYPNNRIKKRDDCYELAYKTWRILYRIDNTELTIIEIKSGYDLETLRGEKKSRWEDIPIHQAFNLSFRESSRR